MPLPFVVVDIFLTQCRSAALLGRQPREGGRIVMLIPLPLPGFLPQSPTFLLPHPPLGDDAAILLSHDAAQNGAE